MEIFEIGMRFPSYKVLTESIEEFSRQTNSRFWKRDARTIMASRSAGIQKFLNPAIIYYEIKYSCIYGGMEFKSKGKRIRNRVASLKSNGCSAYLRFKASEDGDALQLVALNLNHNHELRLPANKIIKLKSSDTSKSLPKRRKGVGLEVLEQMDNVEIEHKSNYAEEEDKNYASEAADDIQIRYEDIKRKPSAFTFRGLMAPVFTPYHNDIGKTLNLELIPTYAQYLVESGISGVLVNGTSGEGTSMTLEERKLVTEAWADTCLQTEQHLMVQIGGCCFPDVIELAQHAEQKKVDSLLCLPELFHKPKTSIDLIRYLQLISQAAPNTPLLYYHIPSFTNVNVHMGTFLTDIQEAVPTFSGIKFTSTMLDEGLAAVKAQQGKFTVFLGADSVMAGAYTLGFDSAIATTLNIFPEHGQRVLQFMKDGHISEAQCAQDELNSAIKVITKNGGWVPTMKEAMALLTPINPGPVRALLEGLSPKHVEQMTEELNDLGLIQM